MYSYEWDKETGGYALLSTPSKFSKEPRPVYYKELDILGFSKYWSYKSDDSLPYMWAEASNYYYRGNKVAKIKGGTIYIAPELVLLDESVSNKPELEFVDIPRMVEKNRTIMDGLVNETIKNIYNTYIEYKEKIDVFYVAFSGGKDSIALLDVVQKALPHNSFKVLFSDTGMENSDTYLLIDDIAEYCNQLGIEFLKAKSHLDVKDTWMTFGYPSSKLRWCCSVHKTTPQIVKLREVLDKPDFKGMAFVGIRKDESITRAKYKTISEGEKHEGQFSFNAIDEWNSAELYLYIYGNKLLINESYKKGNSRVGCLVCPMASGKHEYLKQINYPDETESFIKSIREKSNRQFDSQAKEDQFIDNGGWKVRNNGRDLKIQDVKYEEYFIGTEVHIIISVDSDWQEWIKTIGELTQISIDSFNILFKGSIYTFLLKKDVAKDEFILDGKPKTRQDIKFLSLFRSVLKKSSYCIGCRACEANCSFGYISFSPEVKISSKCVRCFKCHNIDSGCLLYNSIKVLKGEVQKMSLDSYASFGVEKDWVVKYMKHKEGFWQSEYNDLGSMKITALRRFLRDSKIKLELGDSDKIALMLHEAYESGLNKEAFWAILLVNLSYTPQIKWYIKNTLAEEKYLMDEIKEKLGDDVSKGSKGNIASSLKNIFSKTPIGSDLNIGMCHTNEKGNRVLAITRGRWLNPEPTVVLYSLYKFAENCGDYYQFTLSRLLNYSIDSDGVSPTEIFGINRETMETLLNGLAINYPEYISVSFTLDLDNINLKSDKRSLDILSLLVEA